MTTTPALIRAVICGAVDDGKSTLLGRMLVDTGSVPVDEIDAATVGGELDFSLLTDGLSSEREQGITIDVAYRHLALPDGRRVLLADCPGHEQYTRNMAVAASMADVAVLVIDAELGIRRQSFRHAAICARMGVRHLVVALNKIDRIGDPVARFAELKALAESRFAENGFLTISWVPTSGIRGDGVVTPGESGAWHEGSTIVGALSSATGPSRESAPLRFPVQSVSRADGDRWYGGRVALGAVAPGDRVRVPRTGTTSTVAEVRLGDAAGPAVAGQSVAVRLTDEIDLMRGDVLVHSDDPVESHRVWLADLVWLDQAALRVGESYLVRCGPSESPARVELVRSVLDIDSGEEFAGRPLEMNDLGRVELVLDRPLALDPYEDSRFTGGIIVVERATAKTVGAGMIVRSVERESDVTRHAFAIDRSQRERLNGVRGLVIWLTGLSGSGKSTIADEVEKRLFSLGIRSFTLDGDTVRSTLSEDLGFTPEDRRENVRRVARVAELMLDAGLVVLVSLVSPFRADRELARELFANDDFIEVFVDTPLEICEERDPKGLYAKARAADTTSMTGVGQAYEAPLDPELRLDGTQPVERSVAKILDRITARRL